ncbi:hypothetical protein [Elioraea tepidiphila]|jgi:CRISPR-associated protein Csx14|uniref:hypothetical protein n=1 Tax=Elioraea tepidiphila TaxID=457934 RepID=UPI00037AC318|nr:hypothetical protein [Elioraea tepidiphila]
MAEARIPVDLFNPGQVFACLGFMEAAEILIGGAEGGFDWSDPGTVRFRLRADGTANPVREVLGFLAGAKVTAVLSVAEAFDMAKWGKSEKKDKPAKPFSVGEWAKFWKIQTRAIPEPVFPFPFPDGPDVLPAILEAQDMCLPVEHWGDATRRDPLKLWAGAGGMPGAAILERALELVRAPIRDRMDAIAADPCALAHAGGGLFSAAP